MRLCQLRTRPKKSREVPKQTRAQVHYREQCHRYGTHKQTVRATKKPEAKTSGFFSSNTSNRNRCIICSGSGKCSYPTSINNKYYCQGTGKCHYCDGHSTGLPGTTSGYGVRTICGVCKGTNDCSYCHGTGKCSTCNGKGWRN